MSRKTFIIGLPRTGTTSLCLSCVELGFSTAHTAYTSNTFLTAEVLADTPIFNDFEKLNDLFPNSRFIYLSRNLEEWTPSIRRLLKSMLKNLKSTTGGFNDTIKRCYDEVFPNLDENSIECDHYLQACYVRHHERVKSFFTSSNCDYINLSVDDPECASKLSLFMSGVNCLDALPHVNKHGKVTAWKWSKSKLKVASTRDGKADKDEALYTALS